MSKIVVGISGGVDSAYTLNLLKAQGHDVIAVYLDLKGDVIELSKAQKCAEECNAQFEAVSCKQEFSDIVMQYFKTEYILGRTPNPCVLCNREIKIKFLYEQMLRFNADKIATGHYAKIGYDVMRNRYFISVADDNTKDQSYMLWMLEQEMLSKLIFPLGELKKSEIRDSAKSKGMSSAAYKDSTDICFIEDGDYANWLMLNGVNLPSGMFIHADGRNLGPSKSIVNYTVGQRRGLNLAMDKSVYVTKIDPNNNIVVVDYEEGLYKKSFKINKLNFVGLNPNLEYNEPLYVKIRYRSKPQLCKLNFDSDFCTVTTLDEPFKAITPGQSAVFYDKKGHILLGGFIYE